VPVRPPGDLAIRLQEAFTVAVRIRTKRQVAADAISFRANLKQLLGEADGGARQAGYDGASAKLAIYAFVAFLDESVLNSGQTMFRDWAGKPLQEEIFGDHMAGETFFRYLHDLLGQQDSAELGDVLEVFLLCLLLGFRGRYAASDPGALFALIASVQERIRRIRGETPPLSTMWRPPEDEVIPIATDPWLRRLGMATLTMLALTVLLYTLFRLQLAGGVENVQGVITAITG
jgi:type VI secretion system protein ImpK